MNQKGQHYYKTGVLFLLLIVLSMAVMGCSSKKPDPDPEVEREPVVGAEAVPETEPKEPNSGEANQEPDGKTEDSSDPAIAPEAGKDGAKEPVVFDYKEVLGLFELNTDTIVKAFGEPKEIRDEDFFGDAGKVYVYDKAEFSLGYFDDDTPKGMVYTAKIADDTLEAPRDIKIGDSLENVLSKFPQTASAAGPETSPNDPDVTYQMLYGEYTYMNDYGYTEHKNDKVIAVTYADQGILLRITIDQDKVSGYEYVMPTT